MESDRQALSQAGRFMDRAVSAPADPRRPSPSASSKSASQRRYARSSQRIGGNAHLIVTHAGVIRFTLGIALGLPARNLFRLAQDSCAINVIDFLGKGAVVRCING